MKDLGLQVSNNFKWSLYLQSIFSKSYRLVHLILKTFKSRNPVFFINLFKLYIRPQLEYNSSIWNPFLLSDIKLIESIQAKFTKRLCQKLNITFNSYPHRLELLNLESLEIRRIKIDLILTYKILNNLLDIDPNKFFIINPSLSRYNLRRHKLYLQTQDNPNTSFRKNFYSHRAPIFWNQLPEEVVTAETLNIFKIKLNDTDIQSLLDKS